MVGFRDFSSGDLLRLIGCCLLERPIRKQTAQRKLRTSGSRLDFSVNLVVKGSGCDLLRKKKKENGNWLRFGSYPGEGEV